MKLKRRVLVIVLAFALILGLSPVGVNADDEWSNGSIKVYLAAIPHSYRDTLQAPKMGAIGWPYVEYPANVTLSLYDSNGVLIGSNNKDKITTFTGLKEGEYTIKFTVTDGKEYVALLGIFNGGAPFPASQDLALQDFETKVQISQSGEKDISRYMLLETKVYSFATTTEHGTFKNGEGRKEYYSGENHQYTGASDGIVRISHDGIYYGEYASQYEGMNELEIPTLSDTEKIDKGYVFRGWQLVGDDSEKIYSEKEALKHIVYKNTTFKAVWDHPTHSVTFATNTECGDINGRATYSYDTEYNDTLIGDDIPQITPKDGYEFIGWYKDLTTNVIPESEIRNTKVDRDMVFYAKYKPVPKQVGVSFAAGEGGTTTQEAVNIVAGNKVGIIPQAVAGEGYEFEGEWRCSLGGLFSSEEVSNYIVNGFNDQVVFTAVFKKKNLNDGTTPPNNPGDDGGKTSPIDDLTKTSPIGSNEKVLDNAINKLKKDGDIKGATFGRLKARGVAKGKQGLTIKWTKTKGAKKYVLYGNKCNAKGKKYTYKKIKTIRSGSLKTTFKKMKGKNLKKGTYHKFVVAAIDSKGKVIAVSKTVHVTTNGGKKGNDKSIKKVNPKKSTITIKKGKTKRLKVKEIRGKKKVARHRVVSWESSNKKIATVKKGKVKAKAKGKCKIWAYAQNGVYTTYTIAIK